MSPIGHANGIVYKRDMGDNKKNVLVSGNPMLMRTGLYTRRG